MSISIRRIKKRMKNKLPKYTPVSESVYSIIQDEIDISLELLLSKIISEFNSSEDTKLKVKHVSLALTKPSWIYTHKGDEK